MSKSATSAKMTGAELHDFHTVLVNMAIFLAPLKGTGQAFKLPDGRLFGEMELAKFEAQYKDMLTASKKIHREKSDSRGNTSLPNYYSDQFIEWLVAELDNALGQPRLANATVDVEGSQISLRDLRDDLQKTHMSTQTVLMSLLSFISKANGMALVGQSMSRPSASMEHLLDTSAQLSLFGIPLPPANEYEQMEFREVLKRKPGTRGVFVERITESGDIFDTARMAIFPGFRINITRLTEEVKKNPKLQPYLDNLVRVTKELKATKTDAEGQVTGWRLPISTYEEFSKLIEGLNKQFFPPAKSSSRTKRPVPGEGSPSPRQRPTPRQQERKEQSPARVKTPPRVSPAQSPSSGGSPFRGTPPNRPPRVPTNQRSPVRSDVESESEEEEASVRRRGGRVPSKTETPASRRGRRGSSEEEED